MSRRLRTLVSTSLILLVVQIFLSSFAQAQIKRTLDWPVTRSEWTERDELAFGAFVKALAQSGCQNVEECMRSEANPYRDSDPVGVRFWSDCADWPYFLRAYFSWKNQLPFSYVSQTATWDEPETGWITETVKVRGWFGGLVERTQTRWGTKYPDKRYSKSGNYPTARRLVAPDAKGSALNFVEITNTMQGTIDTGFFRFHPEMDEATATDFYPIDIRPDLVRPGAVAYSPLGHVAIVYDVTPEGRILLFNAHPADRNKPGSATPVSRSTFETRKEYVRSGAHHGSGLKQWRPFRLVGAQMKNGRYVGGRVELTPNHELPGFSTVQFFGTEPQIDESSPAVFRLGGKTVTYENFLRMRLASATLDPVADLERKLRESCDLAKGRVKAVQDAIDAGLHLERHPGSLPMNIFSANGAWEDHSSPSRDLRLRTTFHNMRLDLLDQINAIKSGDPTVVKRPNLRAELLQVYRNVTGSCPITYLNSEGQPVTLGFDQLIKRLTLISFDPYHCPERRWGATEARELATCADDATKTAWYQAEQTIRNHMDKNWNAEGPIRLEDARDGKLGFGKPGTPDLDIRALIEKINL